MTRFWGTKFSIITKSPPSKSCLSWQQPKIHILGKFTAVFYTLINVIKKTWRFGFLDTIFARVSSHTQRDLKLWVKYSILYIFSVLSLFFFSILFDFIMCFHLVFRMSDLIKSLSTLSTIRSLINLFLNNFTESVRIPSVAMTTVTDSTISQFSTKALLKSTTITPLLPHALESPIVPSFVGYGWSRVTSLQMCGVYPPFVGLNALAPAFDWHRYLNVITTKGIRISSLDLLDFIDEAVICLLVCLSVTIDSR